jgi:hypothetical protein
VFCDDNTLRDEKEKDGDEDDNHVEGTSRYLRSGVGLA